MIQKLSYVLTLTKTQAAAGYFQAVPQDLSLLDDILIRLQQSPMDSFLHRAALDLVSDIPSEKIKTHIHQAKQHNDLILLALLCEKLLLTGGMGKARDYFSEQRIKELAEYSPLIHLRWALEPNRRLHAQWIKLFGDNINNHAPLPPPTEPKLPLICAGECRPPVTDGLEIKEIHKFHISSDTAQTNCSAKKTTATALEKLASAGVFMEPEMRHQSSLSPIALLRKWQFNTCTENGRHQFNLSGTQTSYGKGLTLDDARASLSMEIVERCAAFVSVTDNQVVGTKTPLPLIYGSASTLENQDKTIIHPRELALEVQYRDEPLYWVEAVRPSHQESEKVWLPAQALFLFLNLDEVDLFSGLGSTGLASGNTLDQAKVSALLEVVERHQESTVPFDPATCFRLVAREDRLAALLESYRSLGIDVLFQDITPPSGIPCCKCFVKGMDGVIHKGTAAHLNARKAIISALTETPYPFPESLPSRDFSGDYTLVGYENLPDFTTGSPSSDLALLEALLVSWKTPPCYVDITRKDIQIPVVRAMVPGMETMGDFDRFSRVHPDLFMNYLAQGKQTT